MKTNLNTLCSRYWMIIAIVCVSAVLDGCKASNTTKGVAIGTGAGAVVGGVVGNQYGNTALGAILGAAVGGTTGAIIGNNMDKQAQELKGDLKDASVERVGEGIKITFDSGLMFAYDSYTLNQTTKANLMDLGKILNKYSDTDILIEGHTDATGTENYNMGLSRKRARAVTLYLETSGVKNGRMTSVGYGETQLLTEFDSDNRRVEVAIYANKKMRKLAEKGELGQ